MNGSMVIPDWTSSGLTYRHTISGGFTMGERNGESTDYTSGALPGETIVQACIRMGLPGVYPEQLFVYDSVTSSQTALQRTRNLSDVTTTGLLYTDYTNIHTFDDLRPARYTSEISRSQFAFGYDVTGGGLYTPDHTNGQPMPANPSQAPDIYDPLDKYAYKPRNVTIKNITVEKYANAAQTGAIGYFRPGLDWTVEDCELRWNHGAGVKFKGQALIKGNSIHHNGQIGIVCGDGNAAQGNGGDLPEWGFYGGYAGYGAQVLSNEINHNYLPQILIVDGWEGGASKFAQSFSLLVDNNYVHHNRRGLWSDFVYSDTTYSNNKVEYNYKEGFLIEISQPGTAIKCNQIRYNGASTAAGDIGAQIWVSNAGSVDIHHNAIVTDSTQGDSIAIWDYSWRNVEGTQVYSHDIKVHDNDFIMKGTASHAYPYIFADTDRSSGTFFNTAVNTYSNNTYHVANAGFQYWFWTGGYKTWAQWQATGQDVGSTIDTNISFVPTFPYCVGYSPYTPLPYYYPPALEDINMVTSEEVSVLFEDTNYGFTGVNSRNSSGYVIMSTDSSSGTGSTIEILGGTAVSGLGLSAGVTTGENHVPYTEEIVMHSDPVLYPITAFKIFYEMTNYSYNAGPADISISWDGDGTSNSRSFPFSAYSTIGSLKAIIDYVPGLAVSGDPLKNPLPSILAPGSGFINPTVSIYFSPTPLRDLFVDYVTISDQILSDRTSFVNARISELNDRIGYLDTTRTPEIIRSVIREDFLSSSDGSNGPGNLYMWADNRFNRGQGCNARLEQLKKQMERNQSALAINQRMY
jgi:hypothetical protein